MTSAQDALLAREFVRRLAPMVVFCDVHGAEPGIEGRMADLIEGCVGGWMVLGCDEYLGV